MTTLQSARKYEELLSGDVEPAPYEYATMFKADGFLARRQAKRRFRLLQGLDAKLRRMLRADERVFFLTWGTTVTIAEHFFVGWAATYLNMRALVFTTERVLLIQVDGGRKKPKELVAQIPYPALASVKSTWNGYCTVKLTNNDEYKFQQVPSQDRKFLAKFLADVVQDAGAPSGRVRPQGIENLCPHCYVHVPQHPAACTVCGGGFKSPMRAACLSFAFPGLGDWYLGHRGFAILELIGSSFLWLGLVIVPLLDPTDMESGSGRTEYWLTTAVTLLIVHGIDGIMTRHFALKGHHPEGQTPAVGNAPPLITPVR